MTSKSK